jgi:DNA primase
MYFDDGEASGFHLKEYTNTELDDMFRKVGFSKVRAYSGGKGIYVRVPLRALKVLEGLLQALPRPASKAGARWLPVRLLLHIYLVAER